MKFLLVIVTDRHGFETQGIFFEACTEAKLFSNGVSGWSSPPL